LQSPDCFGREGLGVRLMIKNIYKNPIKSEWGKLQQRPSEDNTAVQTTVQQILNDVKKDGDEAVFFYNKKLDQNENQNILVTQQEIDAAILTVPEDLKKAIQQAKENITKFHQAQIKEEEIVETMPGIKCWRKSKAIQKVGLYIPSGTAPLFSTVLMLAIPAQLAGCKEIILCSPPLSLGEGSGVRSIHPAILYTAHLCGINKIYKVGGAVAIAAMTYGTATIPKVYKIFGPGNQYVTVAKQLAQQDGVAIDMPAGPSEVCVLADATAVPAYVAADLLSQAEHGVDSQVMLVCTPDVDIDALQKELEKQTSILPRKEMIVQTLQNSKIVIFAVMEEAIDFVNTYAAEHLIICCKNEDDIANKITNAGSIFLGNYSPESVGDYASGTNHTLPTNGYAKQYSGVSIDSFVKKITFQKLTKEGLENIAATVATMAEAEQLQAHSNAVKVRIKKVLN
jgi:histidinol dehydrogenase